MEWLRKALIAMSAVGFLASAGGLVLVIAGADELEEAARSEIVPRVEAKIRDLTTVEPAKGDGKLAALRSKLVEKAREAADRMLGADFPDRIRTQIAELCVCRMSEAERQDRMRRYDEARASLKAKFEAALSGNLSELKFEEGMLGALIGGYYVNTIHGLQRELTIFFGLNLVLFALVGGASIVGAASRGLLLPAGALFAGTVWAGYLFIFERNWLTKIVLNDWTGYGHLILVGIISAYLLYLARLTMLARRAGVPAES